MKEFNRLCKSCMKEIGDQRVCPICGYNQDEDQDAPYLPKGLLLGNRYAVGAALSHSPEGFSYIAYDTVNKTSVYIHEYFPTDFCNRFRGNISVEIIDKQANNYYEFRENFLKYFRSLARLRSLSGIIPIFDIFCENNTVYVVSEWVEGITLAQFVQKNGGHISWEVARPLFMPLVSSLTQIYSSGISHLYLSPNNLLITESGKMKMLGFSIPDIRRNNYRISHELDEGCSALEQYTKEAQVSEVTDIYGFAASIFYALTGSYPKKATIRREDDKLYISKSLLKSIPTYVVSALANALQVYPDNRTVSFERFRAEISASPTVLNEIEVNEENESDVDLEERKRVMSNFTVCLISCSVALLAFLAVGSLCYFGNKFGISSGPLSSSSESDSHYSVISVSEPIKEEVSVPNLVGKRYDELQRSTTYEDDYTVEILSEDFSDSYKEGYIISQIPAVGTMMEKGTTIMVTVSKGSKTRVLPDVSGLSLSEASLRLASAGFKPTQVQESSDSIKPGYVIGYKDNNPGDKLEYGSEIAIIVSLGDQ